VQLEDSIQKRVAFELEAEIKEKTEELRKEARDNADAEVKKQAEAEKERLALQVSISRCWGSSTLIFCIVRGERPEASRV